MEAISNNLLSTPSPSSFGFDRVPNQTLDQQDFLNLLTTQMSNQDPLEPVSDTQFISQMAQFTSLEQAKSDYLLNLANAMIDKEVQIRLDNNGGTTTIQGKVTGINLEQGTPKIIVNHAAYPVDKVVWYQPQQ